MATLPAWVTSAGLLTAAAATATQMTTAPNGATLLVGLLAAAAAYTYPGPDEHDPDLDDRYDDHLHSEGAHTP